MQAINPDVISTLKIAAGANPRDVSAWAWRLIELDVATLSIAKLANDAADLTASELEDCINLAFAELGIHRDLDRKARWIIGAYVALLEAGDQSDALEMAVRRVGVQDPDQGVLYFAKCALDDLDDGADPAYHDRDFTQAHRHLILAEKCREWMSRNEDTLRPLRSKVEAIFK